jgi:hypothetical protein
MIREDATAGDGTFVQLVAGTGARDSRTRVIPSELERLGAHASTSEPRSNQPTHPYTSSKSGSRGGREAPGSGSSESRTSANHAEPGVEMIALRSQPLGAVGPT